MSDRALNFLFSVFMIVVCLGTCVLLLMNGQAESVDGLFLILMCLAVALAFGLYLMFMIKRAMEPPPPPPKPAAKPATAAKRVPGRVIPMPAQSVALEINLGLKDEKATDWDGEVQVSEGQITGMKMDSIRTSDAKEGIAKYASDN